MYKNKKIGYLFIVMIFISVLLAGCGEESTIKETDNQGVEEDDNEEVEDQGKGETLGDKTETPVIEKTVVDKSGSVFAEGFTRPHDLAIDSEGTMYVADKWWIQKVSPDGTVEEFLRLERGIANGIITDGNTLYVTTNNELYKIDQEGNQTKMADGFTLADGLVMDSAGNILVTDAFANIVYKVTPSFEKSIYIDNDLENKVSNQYYMVGIVFDETYKNLYIVRHKDNEIIKYSMNEEGTPGQGEVFCDLSDYRGSDFGKMDDEGNLYVTTYFTNKLLKLDPSGKVEEINLQGAELNNPTGIAFGSGAFQEGTIYITNMKDKNIVKIELDN